LKNKSTDTDKVIAAMSARPSASGIVSKMDEKNHHLHSRCSSARSRPSQFNVVWKTPGGQGQAWSPRTSEATTKPDEPVKGMSVAK
jgi:urea transport system substrate-binding protein